MIRFAKQFVGPTFITNTTLLTNWEAYARVSTLETRESPFRFKSLRRWPVLKQCASKHSFSKN